MRCFELLLWTWQFLSLYWVVKAAFPASIECVLQSQSRLLPKQEGDLCAGLDAGNEAKLLQRFHAIVQPDLFGDLSVLET